MKILFEAEVDITEISPNYFCTDQTNTSQVLISRNYYDSIELKLYVPNTNISIGTCLYGSVNCQKSIDSSNITQNIWLGFSVNYEGNVGTFVINGMVINNDFFSVPNISAILSVSGVFITCMDNHVYTTLSEKNPNRILFIMYSDE